MSIPNIEGPSLYREAIPLAWLPSGDCASSWEMTRYLNVLADFEQSHDFVDELTQQQNAKTDLMLLWLARSLNQSLPVETVAALGLEVLFWMSPTPIAPAEEGVVGFCLSNEFPFLLTFPAKIIACTPSDRGFLLQAEWKPMVANLQDSFEKAIFRYHRRHIHQLKERKQ